MKNVVVCLALLFIHANLEAKPKRNSAQKSVLKIETKSSVTPRISIAPTASPSPVPTTEVELTFSADKLTSQFSSWGINPDNKISSINLMEAWKGYQKKREIVVAVIDTGIDPLHPFLLKNIHVEGQVSHTKTMYGKDFSKDKKDINTPFDDHGHGTHVSGIIKSVHPDVKIMVLKYYNPKASGQDNLNSTIEALQYAVSMNVDIINYSGGGPEPALEELKILKEAQKKGILVVAAAGNEESNIDQKKFAYYPASYGLDNIITVTAHDQNAKILSSSNYGPNSVDISAPGYRIRSALPSGRAGYLTGTSQATAFVSGVAALLKGQYPDLTPGDIKNIVRKSASKENGFSNYCAAAGKLDAANALAMAKNWKSEGKRSVANMKEVFNKKKSSPGTIFYRKVN
jgi:subtilisin family serine protease